VTLFDRGGKPRERHKNAEYWLEKAGTAAGTAAYRWRVAADRAGFAPSAAQGEPFVPQTLRRVLCRPERAAGIFGALAYRLDEIELMGPKTSRGGLFADGEKTKATPSDRYGRGASLRGRTCRNRKSSWSVRWTSGDISPNALLAPRPTMRVATGLSANGPLA
jgi:hypothetical protein